MTTPLPDDSTSGGGSGPANAPDPGASEGWKRRLLGLLTSSSNPLRDAISFSAGFAAAFLPPFGFHSFLVAVLAYLFKLSLPLGLLGSWMNNPWTFIPVFLPAYLAEIKVGGMLLRTPTHLPSFHALSHMSRGAIIDSVDAVFLPFVAGSILFAAMAFLLSLPLVYLVIRWFKRGNLSGSRN